MAFNSDSNPYLEDYCIAEEEKEDESEEREEEQIAGEIEHETHQQVRDAPSPVAPPITASTAISTTPEARLRSLLQTIIHQIPAAHAIASQELLTPINCSVHGLKRKAYETCKNCGADYAVVENYKGACVYHEGVKEVDWDNDKDFWGDHDPDCHGHPKDYIDDDEFAEGFIWTCCRRPGDAKGCVISRHVRKEMQVNKRPVLVPVSRNMVGVGRSFR